MSWENEVFGPDSLIRIDVDLDAVVPQIPQANLASLKVEQIAKINVMREAAYIEQGDRAMRKYLRDKRPKKDWTDIMDAIDASLPYPGNYGVE